MIMMVLICTFSVTVTFMKFLIPTKVSSPSVHIEMLNVYLVVSVCFLVKGIQFKHVGVQNLIYNRKTFVGKKLRTSELLKLVYITKSNL